jgi:3-hydroxyisobutyrate dehydrogenase
MKVAFLGLGAIGAPMASHLSDEPFELTVWNRTGEKARAFAEEQGVYAAGSPADAVREADVVITCLPSSVEVEEILAGPVGILSAISRGALMIDCTSGDPAASARIASQLLEKGVEFIDAPVSGGVKGAIAGTLTVMCGGSEQNIDRARPVLETFGKKIIRCGDIGAGDAVKAMNQALLAIHIWSAGEALAALAKLGVKAEVALDVINGSSGRSNASENLFPERVLGRKYPRTFKLSLLDKDVGIAADIALREDLYLPMIEMASAIFDSARSELDEDADHVEAVKVIESRTGVRIS